ncbi:mCG1046304, isoform CRA_a, partial [Mus musculus]
LAEPLGRPQQIPKLSAKAPQIPISSGPFKCWDCSKKNKTRGRGERKKSKWGTEKLLKGW